MHLILWLGAGQWSVWRRSLMRSSWEHLICAAWRRPHCGLQHLCEGEWRGKYPSFTLVTSDRTQGYGRKLSQGRFGWDIRKKFFTQRVAGHCSSSGKWSQHQPVWEQVFGQCSQAHGVTIGVSWAGPRVGLKDPHGSLLTQHILLFYNCQSFTAKLV